MRIGRLRRGKPSQASAREFGIYLDDDLTWWPDYLKARASDVGVRRVYHVYLDGGTSKYSRIPDYIDELYASFLHSICGDELEVFAYHLPVTGTIDSDRELASRLAVMGVEIESEVLTKRRLGELGLSTFPSDRLEIRLVSKDRHVLQSIFEFGAIHDTPGYRWLLETSGAPFPIDDLRRLNVGSAGPPGFDIQSLWPSKRRRAFDAMLQEVEFKFSVAAARPALVELQEYHGPLIISTRLPESRIRAAAADTARDLRLRLFEELDSRDLSFG